MGARGADPRPRRAVEDGELKFVLHGQKVKGRFTIVRTSGRKRKGDDPAARAFEDDEGQQWLLIKKRDEAYGAGWDAEDHPQSVKTGRTNDDVKADRDALWNGEAPAAAAEIDLTGAVEAKMPPYIEPMLATLASKAFSDPDWLYEIKWDGFRVQAVDRWREGQDLDPRPQGRRDLFPAAVVAGLAGSMPSRPSSMARSWPSTRTGARTSRCSRRSSARRASAASSTSRSTCSISTAGCCSTSRSRIASGCSRACSRAHPRVRFAAHVVGEGEAFFEAAGANQLEGIIAKLRRSRYEPGRRSKAWLKLKVRPEQELVIAGWTPGEGNARDLGALAVGYYEDGKLKFAGKVGSGFTGAMRKELLSKLKPLAIDDSPYDEPPPKDYKGRWGGDLGAVTWVRPELVMRAELGGWTREGVVRQTAYKGLEPGRDPLTVHREVAVATAGAVRAAEAEAPEPRPRSRQ